jgi:MerR family transcriptional regulator/heat shock protein HspR
MAEQKRGPRRRVEGFTISAVAERYSVHPQTLRMYEREGLLTPFRSVGKTRYYSERDLERLEMILTLTRDMGVNLAGVEVILNLREQFARMQDEMTQFLEAVRAELGDRIRDREQQQSAALVPRVPAPAPQRAAGARGAKPHERR